MDRMRDVSSIGIFLYLRNCEAYLNNYLWNKLNCIEKRYEGVTDFSYYILENDSKDATKQLIQAFMVGRKGHVLSKDMNLHRVCAGTGFPRIQRMAFIRNLLLDEVRERIQQHPWCLFIDADIYFDDDALEKMFQEAAVHDPAMMTCLTLDVLENNQQDADVPEGIPFITQQHYYDTYPYVTLNDVSPYPACAFVGCTMTQCKHWQQALLRDGNGADLIYEDKVTKVRAAWAGFVLVQSSVLSNPGVRWKALSIMNQNSLCEHVHFCDSVRVISGKDIVVLGNVTCCRMHAEDPTTFCVSISTIPSRMEYLASKLSVLLHPKNKASRKIACIYVSIPVTYRRFPEWDGVIPSSLLDLEREDGRVKIIRCKEDFGPATKYLGALNHIPDDSWVFVCDDDQDYQWENITHVFNYTILEGHDTKDIWQNGATEEMDHGICGPIAGFKGLFVHSDVLKPLAGFHKHEAMYSVDDQWFLMYATLHGYRIKDTKLIREQTFGKTEENVVVDRGSYDALYIEKPRGHVLRGYVAEHLDQLQSLEDKSWLKWNVVQKGKKHVCGTRNIMVPLYKLGDNYEEMVRVVVHQLVPWCADEEVYTEADYCYHFLLGGLLEGLPSVVQSVLSKFAKHRNCIFRSDADSSGIENGEEYEIA